MDEARARAVQTLITTYGAPNEVLPVLLELAQGNDALREPTEELMQTIDTLPDEVRERVRLDFSLLNDMTYYNGIVFRGYIKGIPDGVLSGGRYDRLMRKMDRTSDAIGFAVYLDRLAGYYTTAPGEVYDTVLLYDDATSPRKLSEWVEKCVAEGERAVAVRDIPDNWHYKEVIDVRGGRSDE